MLSSHLAWVFQVVSFPQVSPPKPCRHLSSDPYVLHAPPISFFSIWPCTCLTSFLQVLNLSHSTIMHYLWYWISFIRSCVRWLWVNKRKHAGQVCMLLMHEQIFCQTIRLYKQCTNNAWVISGFRREVDGNCALLGYFAASSGNFLPTFLHNPS